MGPATLMLEEIILKMKYVLLSAFQLVGRRLQGVRNLIHSFQLHSGGCATV